MVLYFSFLSEEHYSLSWIPLSKQLTIPRAMKSATDTTWETVPKEKNANLPTAAGMSAVGELTRQKNIPSLNRCVSSSELTHPYDAHHPLCHGCSTLLTKGYH